MGENYFETKRPISDVFLGHRIRQDAGDLRALIASIRMIGFIQPITITPAGAVISGGRRLQAAQALGYKTVDVWVRTDISTELDLLLAEQQENQNRKPYTRIEQARFFDQLRRIFAEDAAIRQRATRFGASPGAPESGAPPSAVDPELAGERTQASKRAALIITGNRSDYTLGRVVELLNLQNDPTISEHLRRVVEDALANIDPHGPVEPNYLRVKIAQDTEQLELLATGTHVDPEIGSAARAELAALPAQGRPAQIRQAAKAALQRATATTTERHTALVETRRPPTTIRTYSPRALTEMITELDYWWLHYDPVDAAATLTAEQWEQLTDWVHHTVQFLEEAAAHRQHPAA